MKIPFWDRLSFRQAGYVFLAGIVISMLVGGMQVAGDLMRLKEKVEEDVERFSSMVRTDAAKAALEMDHHEASKAVSGLSRYVSVVGKVEITDDLGKVLASRGKITKYKRSVLWERLLPDISGERVFLLDYEGKAVGAITIHLDEDRIMSDFLAREQNGIVYGMIRITVLTGFIALLFYFFLTSPILKISRNISRVDISGTIVPEIRVPSFHSRDELGDLVSSINKLLTRICQQNTEIKRSNFELERRMEERTQELLEVHQRLLRSERLSVIGKLSGSIAHELRTPLGVLRNSLYYLRSRMRDGMDDESVRRHLDIMEKEVSASDKIITDVLAFGRMRDPQRLAVKVQSVLGKVIDKELIPENIKLVNFISDDLPPALMDADQMVQVFSNIVVNAAQSMPDGGEIRIGASAGDSVVRIWVEDTGEGIPPENIYRMFDPLFSTKMEGTGLGLSLCHSIIEMHKGKIDVESKVGVGSRFTVTLPMA
ncbi:MAG: ATP-binding protein [Candidatus Omnitrophica bacterium]|nr:ATP-binding protein [Candidatus Omnitrophota bacterium]